MRLFYWPMTASLVFGLCVVVGAASATTKSTTLVIRGAAVGNGTSFGSFTTGSTNPLVTDLASLGPQSNSNGTNNTNTATGDFIIYKNYAFSLSQPNAVIFQTALINPYSTYTTLITKDATGDPATAPLTLQWTLPALGTPTVSFTDVDEVVVNEPAIFDTSDLYSEQITFTRLSTDVFRYRGDIIFHDPVTSDQLDGITINGEVSVALEDGGLLVSDADSFALRDDVTSLGTPIGVDGLLVTGKESSTSFVTGPIPEPATWSLMLLGLGATGAALRRRPSRSAA